MQLIKEEKINKEIIEKYSYDFILADDGPPNDKYASNVWDIYTKGIDKRSKPPLKLWFIFIPVMLSLLTAAFWIYNNQGKMFFSYRNEKSGWLCDEGGSWVDAAVLDGFKLKKIKIDEVQEIKGDCAGLKQGGLRYSYFDLDNDGQREIVLDGRWDNGNVVEYYLKIEKDKLAFIPVNGLLLYGYSHSLNSKNVSLYWPDEKNKYTFITETVVPYSNAPNTIFRDLYHFNDKGEIELYRRETEELTGNISKVGRVTEMPLW